MVASLSLFFRFFLVQVFVGLRNQFVNNFDFPTYACDAGFNNNNNNNISVLDDTCIFGRTVLQESIQA